MVESFNQIGLSKLEIVQVDMKNVKIQNTDTKNDIFTIFLSNWLEILKIDNAANMLTKKYSNTNHLSGIKFMIPNTGNAKVIPKRMINTRI